MVSFHWRLGRGVLSIVVIAGLLAAFYPASSRAQSSTLQAGDIAFTGFNADGQDDFAVVAFRAIPGGKHIHFSNEEWDGSAFSGAGGHLTWVAPSGGISAGTVVVFNHTDGDPTVTTGTIIDDANTGISTAGDVIYAYTGSSQDSPDAFLGATATSDDEYNGTEGNLNNTGLTRGSTAILLSDNIDAAQYIGGRSGDTPSGYLDKLNIVKGEEAKDDNWEQFNGNGDQSGNVLPFNSHKFKLVQPPTIALTTDAQSITEGNTATITVELVQASSATLSVDVVFNSSASSAQSDDINGQTATTVQFSNASSGATKDVSISIPVNNGFESREKAVFQLQNNTKGSVIKPKTQTITIKDSQQPDVVINEINYDPGGDANHDGATDGTEDEFVEFVNTSGHNLDISNWTLWDGSSSKYTFKPGTVIPADRSFVVFDAPAKGQGYGGAHLFASGSSLSLNNSGDDVILKNANGTVVTSYHYSGSESNESITRNPDITGNFEGHRSADGDDSSPFSPGTKIDGAPFGPAKYAIGIRGREGWRFVASPTQNTTFDDLFGNLWTQGVPNSDAPSENTPPNLYGWNEEGAGAFSSIGGNGMNNKLSAGKGYILYVYQDDDYRAPGVQGGFPKVIGANGNENPSPVSVAVSSSDNDNNGSIDGNEGYNLLGNPFGTDISVQAVINALASVDGSVNNNVYIYDPNAGSGNGQYVTKSSGTIAPFQAFFVRYESPGVSGKASFKRDKLAANQGTQFYGRPGQAGGRQYQLDINLGNGNEFDTYQIKFEQGGKPGKDRLDAYKLFSLNPDAINLYSKAGKNADIARDVLPPVRSLEKQLSVSLQYRVPHSGKYTFSWDDIEQIPRDIDLYLLDTKTGRKIDLRSTRSYSFSVSTKENKSQKSGINRQKILPPPAIRSTNNNAAGTRFQIQVVPSSTSEKKPEQEQKQETTVSHNYPNPFTPQTGTNLDVTLKHKMHVTMTIYNIVGQQVATIYDNEMDEGEHQMTWNARANTPSGIYLCKVKAGDKIITRKMTLVK